MVNTRVCGTLNSGSTPDSLPRDKNANYFAFVRDVERLFCKSIGEGEKHLAM